MMATNTSTTNTPKESEGPVHQSRGVGVGGPRRRGRFLLILFVLLILAGLAASTMLAAVRTTSDASLERATSEELPTVPVERRTLRSTIRTRGIVAHESVGSLVAASAGRVTGVGVQTGDTIHAGDQIIEVDGRPSIALSGAFPFWRSLSLGARGKDVGQLQRVLAEAGLYTGSIDDVFGPRVQRALREWQSGHQFVDGLGVLQPGDVFVAEWPARVGALKVGLGDFLAPGQAVADITALEQTIDLDMTPSDRQRVAVGLVAEVEAAATGRTVTGQLVEVADVAETSGETEGQAVTYRARIALDAPVEVVDGAQVAVTVILDEREDALAVPLAAVVTNAAGEPIVRLMENEGMTEVPVETGLVDGAYVEIRSGLEGSERVILGSADA